MAGWAFDRQIERKCCNMVGNSCASSPDGFGYHAGMYSVIFSLVAVFVLSLIALVAALRRACDGKEDGDGFQTIEARVTPDRETMPVRVEVGR